MMCKTYGLPAVLYLCGAGTLHEFLLRFVLHRAVAFLFRHFLSQTCITLLAQVHIRWSLKLGVVDTS